MVMRGLGVGAAPRRASAGASVATTGGDESVPPGGSSTTASRPPLRAIQQPRPAPAASSRKPNWPATALAPSRGPGPRAVGKTLARRSASLAPARSLRKPASRLGIATTGAASSGEVPSFKVREAISFWEENRRSVQDSLFMLQQHDSDAIAKIDRCSDEGSVSNTEDILSLQLELDMLKTILMEEVKARAQAADWAAALGDELKAANFHILEACRQKEVTEKKLNKQRTSIEYLELELQERVIELNEMKEKGEVCREAEIATSEVISSLTEQLSSVKLQLDSSKKNELLAKQNLDKVKLQLDSSKKNELLAKQNLDEVKLQLDSSKKNELLAKQNLDESIEALMQKEVLEQNYISLIRRMEEEIRQLDSQLYQSNRFYEVRLKELEIKMQELDDEASTLLASWNKEREIAEQRQAYIEQLELGNDDLRIDVCELEKKVNFMEEEAEHQRVQRGKIEAELQNVKLQLQAVTSYGKPGSFLEDGIVDLADTTRYQNDMNIELSGAQEVRIFQREVSVGPAPQVEHSKESFSNEHMQEVDQSDVEMEKAQSDMVYWSENSHPSASEELGQISAGKQPELFGSGAYNVQPLSPYDSEQVRPPAVESVIEVLEANELPPVAPVRPNDPRDYMRAPSDELKRLRSRNHYEGPRTATDMRFWSIEQQDLYSSIYSKAKLFAMRWIDWGHIDRMDQSACVREQCAHLGLEMIMSYRCDWNSELIKQFYSTVHISDDKSSMTWMADGRRITTNKRAWEKIFGVPGGVQTKIHKQFLLDDDDKRILYSDAECTLGQTIGLSPLPSIANKIIRKTIYPRAGNTLHRHNWNLLHHIVEQQPFDIIALIFDEIELFISDRNRTKDQLLYAPYIMGMINEAFKYDGHKESTHLSYKPKVSYKLKRTKRVGRPPAHPVAAPSEQPPSTFQPEVEAHVDADHHSQFKAAGHWPHGEGEEAVKGQTVLAQAATPAPAVSSSELSSGMHTHNSSVSAQPAHMSPCPFSQPVLVRSSPFSRFPWYQREK